MKTKRFLAVLVTCVFAFVVCAVPAMAKVIPTVPGEKASVALEVLNTDGTDCEGNIKQTAAQQSGADQSMTQQGDYITYQAENPEIPFEWMPAPWHRTQPFVKDIRSVC